MDWIIKEQQLKTAKIHLNFIYLYLKAKRTHSVWLLTNKLNSPYNKLMLIFIKRLNTTTEIFALTADISGAEIMYSYVSESETKIKSISLQSTKDSDN